MNLTFARTASGLVLVILALASGGSAAIPEVKSEMIHAVEARKRSLYFNDGIFSGGDRAINDVIVLDVRRASNNGFDRIVLDLEGSRDGEPAAIERPPYYQVALGPELNRISLTLWGNPKLAFDARKVLKALRQSPLVRNVELLPVMDQDRWTFVMDLKKPGSVEVFELSNPVRIIVDIQT